MSVGSPAPPAIHKLTIINDQDIKFLTFLTHNEIAHDPWKTQEMKLKLNLLTATTCGSILTLAATSMADTSFLITAPTADAFLATGSPSNPVGTDLTSLNFGGAGTLALAPAGSTKGEMDSVVKFNTAAAISQFNSTYGAGNWAITGVTLTLASNFGGQGEQPNNGIFNSINAGSFGIDWLGYDSWVEGDGSGMGTAGYPNPNNKVSFQSISTLFSAGSSSLGNYTYTPPGDNVAVTYTLPLNSSLLGDAAAGGDLSLYFFAADNQVSMLFNARSFGSNRPELTLAASAIPEPTGAALLALSLGSLMVVRKRSKA